MVNTEPLNDLVPQQAGHHVVTDDGIEVVSLDAFEPRVPIAFDRDVESVVFEDPLDEPSGVQVVLDDEEPLRTGLLRPVVDRSRKVRQPEHEARVLVIQVQAKLNVHPDERHSPPATCRSPDRGFVTLDDLFRLLRASVCRFADDGSAEETRTTR